MSLSRKMTPQLTPPRRFPMSNLKVLWGKVKAQLAGIWDKDRGFIILIGILAVVVKFRDILIDLLLNSGKRVEKNAQAKDAKLATQESDLKTQADALVVQAANEPKKEEVVDENWYKKTT